MIFQSPFESTQLSLASSKDNWSSLLSAQLNIRILKRHSKRKCPSESVSELDVLESLGTVPPSRLHDTFVALCDTTINMSRKVDLTVIVTKKRNCPSWLTLAATNRVLRDTFI